jgi:hypothetical protein
MPNRFFLNALRKGRQLANPDTGHWKDDSLARDFLVKFASDILVEGQIADVSVAHSVPSVFARPVLFYQALRDAGNPLHDAVVGEWRGLLAVFGLQAWNGFSVTVQQYDVPPADPTAASEVGRGGKDDLHLRMMLRQQLPRPESDWTRWWLIRCGGQLIGATSPWTMVYTPAQYAAPGSIPWTQDGLLRDPIEHFDPRGRGDSLELALLLRWVELVQQAQDWDVPDHLQTHALAIAEQLEAWRADLARYARADVTIDALAEHPPISEPPYSRFLLFPPETARPAETSDLLLRSKKLGDRKVLALYRTKSLEGKRLWGPVLADQVDIAGLPGPSGDKFATRAGKEYNVPYAFPEEAFLPPKLVELPLARTAMQRGSAKLALPLTPAFFEYFDAQDLADHGDMLKVNEADQTVIVTLRLPLSGGRSMAFEKTYNRASDVLRWEPTPAFAVWPDFYAEDWQENFAAFAAPLDTSKGDFCAAPLLADGKMMVPSVNDRSQLPVRIWRCVSPPIGFSLTYRNPGSNVTLPVGLVLQEELQHPAAISETTAWGVSLDFGTSSTVVMARKKDGDPELLSLAGRTRFLSESPLADDISLSLYPAAGAVPPFCTLLYEREATLIGGGSSDYTLRFVYFPGERKKPLPNVKWGTKGGQAEQEQLKQYLEGLVRYIAAEARFQGVGKLKFNWSYPLALPANALRAMSDFWSTVARTYTRGRSMTVEVGESVSESDAVCRCLASLKTQVIPIRADTLTIAVDVGGGSTDVGFWSAGNLLDQVSCKVAANDVLDPRWVELEDFPRQLYWICDRSEIKDEVWKGMRDRASIYLNQLLTQAKDDAGKVFNDLNPATHPVPLSIHKHGAQDPPWLYLRSMAYLFFNGISYYLGLHARKLQSQTGVKEIYVYFAGRGASLLNWLTTDNKKLEQILCDAFQQGFVRDNPGCSPVAVTLVGPAIKFMRELPPPKHEVAIGLLCGRLGVVAKAPTTVVGEVRWKSADGTEIGWNTEVTAAQLANLKPPDDHESSYAYELLKIVLPRHADINLEMTGLQKLTLPTAAIQERLRRSAEVSEQVLQPIFACELKTLMDKYLDSVLHG